MSNRASLKVCLGFWMLATPLGCGRKHSAKTATPEPAIKSTEPIGGSQSAPTGMPEIAMDEPSAQQPVAAGCAFGPELCQPGSTTTLFVKVRAMAGWHFYAIDKPVGVNIPTKISVVLPDGVKELGPWTIPEPEKYAKATDETWIYHGEVVFKRSVAVDRAATPGKRKATVDFAYQACRDDVCKPPTSLTIDVPIQIEAAK